MMIGNGRLIAALGLVAFATIASACNIPVFRYALERWRSDAYEVVVSHRDPLTPAQHAFVTELEAAGQKANCSVAMRQDSAPGEPKVAVRLAMPNGRTVSHWQGSLDEAAQGNLLESPSRKELVKRLLAGDSVVWLLIKSNDEAQSNAARDALTTAFATLGDKIQLPQGIGEPGSELHSEVPLLVKFSLIEIDAEDEQEAFLVKWMSGFRPESLPRGEPLLVPVFGRGRALEVIPAGEVTAMLIDDLTRFLSGACSCQVKEQNPGFDLLLMADWDQQLFGDEGLRPPPPKTVADGAQAPRTLTIPPGKRK